MLKSLSPKNKELAALLGRACGSSLGAFTLCVVTHKPMNRPIGSAQLLSAGETPVTPSSPASSPPLPHGPARAYIWLNHPPRFSAGL